MTDIQSFDKWTSERLSSSVLYHILSFSYLASHSDITVVMTFTKNTIIVTFRMGADVNYS